MSEVLLNAILHIFALIAGGKEKDTYLSSSNAVKRYLSTHARLSGSSPYLELYTAFLDLSKDLSDLERKKTIWSIGEELRGKLAREEQFVLVLNVLTLSLSFNAQESLDILGTVIAAALDLGGDELEAFNLLVFHANNHQKLDNRFLILDHGAQETPQCRSLLRPDFSNQWTLLEVQETGSLILMPTGEPGLSINDVPADPGHFRLLMQGDILRDISGCAIYHSEIISALNKRTLNENFVFTGHNLNFRFPGSDNGLHSFSFKESSGRLVGVMGGSGAGKSTLLSILNGTLKPDSGNLFINSIDLYSQSSELIGVIGYVPQDDLLINDLTVSQNLYYSARLCLDNLNETQLQNRMDEILMELNQLETRDLKVGSPLDKTISGGQRKRLNIALELIREPAILFADEPTSGLSSADSLNVISLLKAQAAKGCLVIAVIHQPSSSIFKMFDALWVLDKGGRPVFQGNPQDALKYFRSAVYLAGGSQGTCSSCGSLNPEQIFDILEIKELDGLGRATAKRRTDPAKWHNRYLEKIQNKIDLNFGEHSKDLSIALKRLYKPNLFGQFSVFFTRNFLARMSNQQYLLVNLLEAPFIALLLAILCRTSPSSEYIFRNNANIPLFFFMSVIVALFMGLSISADEIVQDRQVLKREAFLNLSWFSYINSKCFYLAGLTALQTISFVLLSHFLLEVPDMIFKTWAIQFACGMCACLLGLNISSVFKSAAAIYILIPLLLIPQMLLSGFVLNIDDLVNRNAGNNTTPLYADAMPSRWGYEALLVEQYTENQYMKPFIEPDCRVKQADYILDDLIPEMRSLADYIFIGTDDKLYQEFKKRHLKILNGELIQLASSLQKDMPSIEFSPEKFNKDALRQLKHFLDQAASELRKQRTAAFNDLNALDEDRNKKLGLQGVEELQNANVNKSVARAVLNSLSLDSLKISGDNIVQVTNPVCKPVTIAWGRAHFMAGTKRLGAWVVPTYWFNLSVLSAMTIVLYALLQYRLLSKCLHVLAPLLKRR